MVPNSILSASEFSEFNYSDIDAAGCSDLPLSEGLDLKLRAEKGNRLMEEKSEFSIENIILSY